MGDRKRFDLFAAVIDREFPGRDIRIADVASGRGYLQAALYLRGYKRVVSWDVRKRNAVQSRGYHYGLFDYRNAPRDYDLAVGMHPDGGTDHVVLYAAKHRVPFVVCPCCVIPSAAEYGGKRADYHDWVRHLAGLAKAGGMSVEDITLPMSGRNRVLVGRPQG